jgi:peroxiredoxin
MQPTKMVAGAPFPQMSWPTVEGGELDLASGTGWRLLVVYRGKHCPLCKGYLKTLNELSSEFETAGIAVSVLSADPLEKAQADVAKYGWTFPVGHDLTPDQMRVLGLYISEPLSDQETDRPFAEPGLFVINPDGRAQIIDISNAPFVRPDLKTLFGGLQFVIARDYPVRGQA